MIRPFTCLCLVAAAASGLYLYTAKHDAQMLDRDINRLSRQAQDSRARAAMMRAEYDRLGDPERLRELASQVLTLQPTDPKQFSTMADLDSRLPPAARSNDEAQPQIVASLALAPSRAITPPERPAVERPVVERPVVERPAAQIVATRPASAQAPAPRPSAVPAPSVLASAQPMAIVPAPQPMAAPRPIVLHPQAAEPRPPAPAAAAAPSRPAAPVQMLAAIRRAPVPEAPPSTTAEVIARAARGGALDTSSPVVASALGMARSMMTAPSPVSTANAQSYTPSAYQPQSYPASALAPTRR